MKKIANNATYVFAIVLMVAVIVLLVWGIVSHSEPGLMTACVNANDVYEYDGECFDVQMEGTAPFIVDVSTSNPHPPDDPIRATERVVHVINTRVNFNLLRMAEELDDGLCLDDATICVKIGVPHETGALDANGDAAHMVTPMGLYCEARTSNTGTRELLHLVLQHEIGHCLGLAHDDYPGSIMHPTQEPTPDRQFPPRISDSDRSLLRQIYR